MNSRIKNIIKKGVKMKYSKLYIVLIAIICLIGVKMLDGKNEKSKQNDKVKVVMKTNMGSIELELDRSIAPKTVDNFVGLANGTKEWKDPQTGEMVKKPFYDGLAFHRVISDFMIQGGCPIGNGTGGPGYTFEDETYVYGDDIYGEIANPDDAYRVYTDVIVPFFQRSQQDDTFDEELIAIITQCQQENSPAPIMTKPYEFYYEKTNSQPLKAAKGLTATVDYGTICMANSGPNTNGSQFFIVTKKEGCSWLNGKHTVFGKVTKGMDIVHKIEGVEKGANDKPVKPVIIEKVTIK